MNELTIKKIHEILEKLSGYVMEKIPKIEQKLDEKADKKDVQKLLNGQDKIVGELDSIRTEQVAFNHAFGMFEKWIGEIEKRKALKGFYGSLASLPPP